MIFFSLVFASESRVQVPSEEEREKDRIFLFLMSLSFHFMYFLTLRTSLIFRWWRKSRRSERATSTEEEIVYFICFLMSLLGEERALKSQLKWSQSMATTADAGGKESTWRVERVLCVFFVHLCLSCFFDLYSSFIARRGLIAVLRVSSSLHSSWQNERERESTLFFLSQLAS